MLIILTLSCKLRSYLRGGPAARASLSFPFSWFFLTILLVSSFGYAQNPDYNTLWNKVENYELEGLPKSALNVVEEIDSDINVVIYYLYKHIPFYL